MSLGNTIMSVEQMDSVRWSPKPGESSDLMSAREVEHLLCTLRQSWDLDELRSALLRIQELFPQSICQFEQLSAHVTVLETMENKRSYLDIQRIGLQLLLMFIRQSAEMLEEMQQTSVIQFLLRLLLDNTSDLVVQMNGMKILSKLIAADDVKIHLTLDNKLQLVEVITKDMTTFMDDCDLLIHTLNCLSVLLRGEKQLQEQFSSHHLALFLRMLCDHMNEMDLVLRCLRLLHTLANTATVRLIMLERGVLPTIYQCLKTCKSEIRGLELCFKLLMVLCREEAVVKELVERGVVMEMLAPEMMSKADNADLQLFGLTIFSHTAEGLLRLWEEQGQPGEVDVGSQWLKVIYMAMSRQMASSDVLAMACRALCKLLEYKPDLYMLIGEGTDPRQDPVHTLCLGAILMYPDDSDVFAAAANAIYYLTADNETLCKLLWEKSTFIAIADGFKLHQNDPPAVCAACRALHGLCIFNDEYKEQVANYDGDVLSLLVSVLKKYPDSGIVQSEAISTIACLADVDTVRNQCFVVGVHMLVLLAMDNFPGDDILQEACIEALAVLVGAASGAELLHSLNAVNKIILCLKRFVSNYNIQKKGLMAIQVLVDPRLLQSAATCADLTDVLKTAMLKFPSKRTIQKEAVVAMQILAERGLEEADGTKGETTPQHSLMSETLVDHGCHEVLFQILENFEEDEDAGLHGLASECLYVIGIEQDLKSRMLVAACSKGYLIGAECLIELGADVNTEIEGDTPLYCAVKNKDLHMVRMLLRQEIRDVQRELKLSLHQETHEITGLILSYIGQDREMGKLLWSNYGLCDLRPEWLMPSLTGQSKQYAFSVTSKHFVSRLQHSGQQRKHRRLSHSQSDSNLEVYRHKCFRFRRNSGESRMREQQKMKDEAASKSGRHRRNNTYPKSERSLRMKSKDASSRMSAASSSWRVPERKLSVSSSPPSQLSTLEGFSIEEEELPVFMVSEDDMMDWKQTTVTGANIPFSPSDPRLPTLLKTPEQHLHKPPGRWLRKYSQGPLSPADLPVKMVEFRQTNSRSVSPADFQSDLEAASVRGSASVSASEETDLETSQEGSASTTSTLREEFNPITCIDVSANRISSLEHLVSGGSDFVTRLATLKQLDLGHNNLESLPEGLFKCLPSLSHLDLTGNRLCVFPQEVVHCQVLTFLSLTGNLLTDLDLQALEGSLKIEVLNVSENQLSAFPRGLDTALPVLQKLSLASNHIGEIPDVALGLPELRYLDISHNQVVSIPDSFLTVCAKLETLKAANNKLVSLPSETVASGLVRLSTLRLSNNSITEKEPFFVPKFILELPNLRVLDLAVNCLEGLPPPTQWKTQILKELVVSQNRITKLNLEGVRAWSKLEKLHIARNKITELPREIGHLVSLQSLDITYNKQLNTLPDELGKCDRLWEMPFDGLSLDLDVKMTKGRVQDLRIYLHNRLKKAKNYYRMKMMVVGYGNRGKTSLLQALKKKVRNNAEEPPPVTVGVIVDEWKFERQRNGKSVTYTLSTWDFAGQEDFYSTHQCFLTNRTLYLVVYDVSLGAEEVDRLKPWLSNIHARAPSCPVIVVGTHYDVLPPEKREEVMESVESKLNDLSHKPGFPAISCQAILDLRRETPELERLRRKVLEIVDGYKVRGQPVMGQKVPASYVRLAELLSEEAQKVEKSFPVIRHAQLLKIVQNERLDLDEDELKQAVSFLHESGVLLHYDETTLQMRDFYFINPGWLCRMMAQVVTVPQINPFIGHDGVMKRNSAYMLFTGKAIPGGSNFTFPSSLIPQYLHLLEKFEIALPRNDDELLFPCRLPPRRPPFHMPQLARSEMAFRHYIMPYVPIGFWSRLLTRLIVFAQSKFIENLLQLGTEPAEVHSWQEGLFVMWKQDAFFLVDGCRGDREEVHVTVPATSHGVKLLGYLVDHIDSLVDEWYPGLTCIEPLLGHELLEKYVPCTSCTDEEPHLFLLTDLVTWSEKSDIIVCPQHGAEVRLSQLAPDVMLADIESNFRLDQDQFVFNESPENLLGGGGFGSVYKAHYRDQTVATKVFSPIGDVHPHKMLRQESTIMRRLKHPSVVSLVAVARRPRFLMVMEFAPLGSLAHVLHTHTSLSRTLQHKIILQVAEGLHYLQQLMIVYRDMKPDNVLIFSLSPDAVINAKITDYGISQFTTLSPLLANQGTPSYRAPEVIRGEIYSFQADVFSFGILMYMVLTGGQHPFEELEFQSERDKAFADNWAIQPITQRVCAPWPDMEELINRCMHQVPDFRPKAEDICQQLNTPELFCLREILPVSKETTVECMTFQEYGSKGQNMRLWVASGDNEYMQLTWLSLQQCPEEESVSARRRHKSNDYNGMGTMFRDGRILCVLQVTTEHVLLGTQAGKIWVFNTHRSELLHASKQLQDSVLCMYLISSRKDDSLVLAGLANGKIALYPVSEILQERDAEPIELKLGETYEPLCTIIRSTVDSHLIASCGTKIILIDVREGVAVNKMLNIEENSGPASQPILTMACGRHLFLSRRNQTVVQAWDVMRGRCKSTMDISKQFNLPVKDSRITAMVLQEQRVLWVGTGGGQLALVDVHTWSPLTVTHRHTASIRCLLSVRLSGSGKYGPPNTNIILSGGLGFRRRPDIDMDRDDQYGCIAVWEADFPQVTKTFKDQASKRQQLLDR